MQLNLAHNALKKMPTGVPNRLIQLYLDKNRIDDIPKQVNTMHTFVNEHVEIHTLQVSVREGLECGICGIVFNL